MLIHVCTRSGLSLSRVLWFCPPVIPSLSPSVSPAMIHLSQSRVNISLHRSHLPRHQSCQGLSPRSRQVERPPHILARAKIDNNSRKRWMDRNNLWWIYDDFLRDKCLTSTKQISPLRSHTCNTMQRQYTPRCECSVWSQTAVKKLILSYVSILLFV